MFLERMQGHYNSVGARERAGMRIAETSLLVLDVDAQQPRFAIELSCHNSVLQ